MSRRVQIRCHGETSQTSHGFAHTECTRMSIAIMNGRIKCFCRPPPPTGSIPFQFISVQWRGVIIDCINIFSGGGVKDPFLWYINSVPWPNQLSTQPYVCKQELRLCSSRARFRKWGYGFGCYPLLAGVFLEPSQTHEFCRLTHPQVPLCTHHDHMDVSKLSSTLGDQQQKSFPKIEHCLWTSYVTIVARQNTVFWRRTLMFSNIRGAESPTSDTPGSWANYASNRLEVCCWKSRGCLGDELL